MQDDKLDFTKVGQRIRVARKDSGMTQEAVSVLCHCTSKHISAEENGSTRPSIELLVALSRILNVSIDSFLIDAPTVGPRFIIDVAMAERAEKMTAATRTVCLNIMDQLLSLQQ